MVTASAAATALVTLPAVVLLASYVWLACDHGTAWLLPVVVHEAGRYTLGETILYFRHLLRELPIAILYAAASAGAYAAYGPGASRQPSRTQRVLALTAVVALVATAWIVTASRAGNTIAAAEVLQSYLRDEDVPVAGIHWGYHLLSTVGFTAAAVALAAWLTRVVGRARGALPRPTALAAPLAGVVLLTGLTGPTWRPLRDPRYLGHQARELATHLVVTLPLSFAILLAIARPRPDERERSLGTARTAAVGAVTAGSVLAYLALRTLASGAVHDARPGVPASSLLGAHVFEHGLDYVLVAFLTVAFAPAARADVGSGTA